METGAVTAECAMKAQDVGVLLWRKRQLYRAGDPLLPNGDMTPYCYKVCSGVIALSRTEEEKTTIFGIVTPGKFFGEEALFGDNRRHDARALTESVVKKVCITPDTIRELVKDMFERAYFLEALYSAKSMFRRIRLIEEQYDIGVLPRATIAEMLSGSRETVSEYFSSMRKSGRK